MKTNKFILTIAKIILFKAILLNSSYANAIPEIFKECLNEKYEFICADQFAFINKIGIDIEKDLIDFNELNLIQEKTTGASKGGIYSHAHDPSQIYFVKHANSFREFISSRLLNFIVGTEATPIIKLIKNKSRTTASLKLKNFKMVNKADLTNKTILGEVLLIVAMDFIGLIDRHSLNSGYVTLNENTLLAARVDFDASFDFESVVTGSHQFLTKTHHLDLKHLYVTMQSYPKDQVKNAIKKIIEIPDEQIIMIAFQAWGVLSQTHSPKSLEKCLQLATKLIERKRAFKDALKEFSIKQHKEISAMFH